jgi:tRNA A37 N6-isopentenylltransferase MiaA
LGGDETAAGPTVHIICGPTAAGKSALALQLAAEHPVTIICADSRQIYRRFDIGTAKPSAAERAAVPHAGIDLVDPEVRFSSFAWAAVAAEAIAAASAAGRTPLVVGGAGFYLRALANPAPGVTPYRARYLVVDPGPALQGWIACRIDAMLDAGWVEEVRALDGAVPDDAPAWQASGYATVRALVRGRLTRAAAHSAIVVATRQYAKRQRTWFRHQIPAADVTRIDPRGDAVTEARAWLAAAPRERSLERGERREVTR